MVKRSIVQDVRNKIFGIRSGNCEKNAVVKSQGTKQRVHWILGDCWQWETNGRCVNGSVSATIMIIVEKLHHQIRLRILSCSRMSENHREPEVPEERVPVVICLDGLARITSKGLAITHFVKIGTLQNACSTRIRVVVDLGKLLLCASSGWWTADLKVQKEWWQRCSGFIEEGWLARKRICLLTYVTNDQGNLMAEVRKRWDKNHLNVDHLMHVNWVVYSKTWRRRSLFSGRAQTCGTNPTCEIHKGYFASDWNSRPKSFARIYLPRRTSWA